MSRPVALDEEEVVALRRELQRLVDEWHTKHGKTRGGLRAIGVELGFERHEAQSYVSSALNKRFGESMAARIYERLGVTREEFAVQQGLRGSHPQSPENRVFRIAAELGMSAADALEVSSGIAALSGQITDEEIAGLFKKLHRKLKLVEKPATAPGTGGGFAGKIKQRERPPPSDDEEEADPGTKINPRRKR